MKRVLVLSTSKRFLSASAISRPPPPPPLTSPPPHCNLSPQSTSAGDDNISFSSSATEKFMDILFRCKTIKQLKQVHLHMLINGLRDDDTYNYLADKVMLLTSDLISFDYSYNVFMYLSSNPNLSSYNNLIKCSIIGKSDAVSAYNRMRYQDNISPDRFTFGFLFKSFTSSYRLKSGKMMQCHVIKLGFVSDTFVLNSLLEFYFQFVKRCGHKFGKGRHQLRAVRKVFGEMPDRDIVSWNAMISGLLNKDLFSEAMSVFDDMLLLDDHRCKPDETTLLIIIMNNYRIIYYPEQGKWLDEYIKENKLVLSLPLGNALIYMFACYDDLDNAKVVFKNMSKRCAVTWRLMIDLLVSHSYYKEVVLMFDTMCCCSEEGGPKPDAYIFSSVIFAFFSDPSLVGDGKRLFSAFHKMMYVFGLEPSYSNYNQLIIILIRVGWLEAAMVVLEGTPWETNSEIWGKVLYACQIQGNENLLDLCIRKIDDIDSKQGIHNFGGRIRKIGDFRDATLCCYINVIVDQIRNDVNYGKLIMPSLFTKLSYQYDMDIDFFNKYLEGEVKRMASTEVSNYLEDKVKGITSTNAHAHETYPLLEDDDDVYKVAESLEGQLLDLHDQMVSNTDDDPCQLAILF
ncbi:hypothetical protein CASFOL_004010 [Castilleja foliolosa]|uniref:Pentatricopeptide repeat-containing protein n=1 Tax=Castilleja foliolosa TaxID=1961234 RepID=A0ABD3EJD9_9LAMI